MPRDMRREAGRAQAGLTRTITPPGGSASTETFAYGTTNNRLTSISGDATRSLGYDAAGTLTLDTRTAPVSQTVTLTIGAGVFVRRFPPFAAALTGP